MDQAAWAPRPRLKCYGMPKKKSYLGRRHKPFCWQCWPSWEEISVPLGCQESVRMRWRAGPTPSFQGLKTKQNKTIKPRHTKSNGQTVACHSALKLDHQLLKSNIWDSEYLPASPARAFPPVPVARSQWPSTQQGEVSALEGQSLLLCEKVGQHRMWAWVLRDNMTVETQMECASLFDTKGGQDHFF